MRKPIKLWLKALRSGKYKQGQDHLKIEDEYCCLGVAVDVYNKCHKIKVKFPKPGDGEDLKETSGTRKVKQWLRLSTTYGNINDNTSLVTLNDDGHSFEDIANVIESNPKGLFIR